MIETSRWSRIGGAADARGATQTAGQTDRRRKMVEFSAIRFPRDHVVATARPLVELGAQDALADFTRKELQESFQCSVFSVQSSVLSAQCSVPGFILAENRKLNTEH